jgi:hypothetical protein
MVTNELRLAAAKSARDLGATRVAFDAGGMVVAVEFAPGTVVAPFALEPDEPAPKGETPAERQARIDRVLFASAPG